MKNTLALSLLLFFAATVEAQPITYIDKNVDRFECVDIYDATTAKRLTAAVTGADCEYAQTLNGSANESAYTDLTTAESVVGSAGQLCFKILAAEDNIDGTIKVSCKASNTNAADYVGRFSTVRPRVRINSGDATYDAVAARGTLQAASSTTATIASAESSADNRWAGTRISILGGTAAGSYGCVASNVNSTDVLTLDSGGWSGGTPNSTSTYDLVPDAACAGRVNSTGVAAIWANAITEITAVPGVGSITAGSLLRLMYQMATHRMKIDTTTNEITFYRSDGTTVWTTKDYTDNGTVFDRTAHEADD